MVNYTERNAAKLRSIEKLVKADYRQKNNLKKSERKAVEELRIAVKNKQIVICKSDKDGKIVLVNYRDYNVIIEKELSKFSHLHTLITNNIKSYLNKIRKTAEDKIIELHQHGAISDDLLKHTVGVILYDHFDIPSRLLQSACNITTSKITALLEYIFQPIRVKFCSSKLDEYCRDSKHYLLNLVNWKNNAELDLNQNNLYIVAGDVKFLYPSIPRSLVEKALTFAFTYHSFFTQAVIDILIILAMFCLHNVIIQHKQNFYTQKTGIITGDHHSISPSKIT